MTTAEYALIAKVIASAPVANEAHFAIKTVIVARLAAVFARENPHFEMVKFIEACR